MIEEAPPAESVTDVVPEADEPRRRKRRRRMMRVALGVVLVAVGVGAWFWITDDTSGSGATGTAPVATVVVERGTISDTNSWDGTLEFGAPVPVRSNATGTVTRLVGQAETVRRGDELYRVNEQPVTLLDGVVPMYRDLTPGTSGVDVEQLEKNLAELGYTGFTLDDEYTGSTGSAVRAWQGDAGAVQTGTVARGDVVFVPAGRVGALHVAVGDPVAPGVPVLDITATEQVVSLDVAVDDRDLVAVDTAVTVVLPGGDQVPGTVRATAVVKVASDGSGMGTESTGTEPESIVQVEISLDGDVPDDLAGASVEAIVAVDERVDVLLVPVTALLALAEGDYGLEVVAEDGTTSIVTVTTGLFADGKVQVEGDEISEGTVVGVAGR